MTKEEAKQILEAFFSRLGEKASFFDGRDFAKARIGEAVVGFEYDEADGVLSCEALIYRFRREPRDEILDAAFAEENENGGGRVVYDSETLSLYLQCDFQEAVAETEFFEQIHELAVASLHWNSGILTRVAEKVSHA
ncbi:MAG: hypothetical protein LUM44_04800 [Pyrinomonadaceae bacterium]|nr:hypothetical protein [Pyrinomonadaceae bacterium]